MKRIWRYVDEHCWAQWAAAALLWGAWWAISELVERVLGR